LAYILLVCYCLLYSPLYFCVSLLGIEVAHEGDPNRRLDFLFEAREPGKVAAAIKFSCSNARAAGLCVRCVRGNRPISIKIPALLAKENCCLTHNTCA
jgi:hypothetical protein